MATNKSKNSNSKTTTKKSSTGSKKQTTPNYQKKAVKTVKKAAKKNPKAFIIVLLVVLLVIGIGVAVYFLFLKDKLGPKGDSSSEPTSSEPVVVKNGISINFLELGNKYTGDSTYIKAGDVDILIDAGSRKDSATTIKNYVDKYCTDGTLEYVIATHAHQDHIAGFVGSKANPGILDTFKIDTLIDFSQITDKLRDDPTAIYTDYITKRDAKVASGDIAHHYTALQCVEETDGAKKEYTLAEGITMTILDHEYYHSPSKDENDHSVCTLFTQGSNHYLLTGDLEEKGEKSLVAKNTLPHCQLFKGGHHGSYTASNDVLLDAITPESVCICCCCGTDEYDRSHANPLHWFPAQEAIDRMAKHTDKIYATTLMVNNETGEYTSMNGNIVFKCDDGINYTITGSNNSVILKETDWFKENRTWPEGGK